MVVWIQGQPLWHLAHSKHLIHVCCLKKKKYMCAVCHPSEPKLQDSRAFGLVCCYITCLGDTLLGAPSVTSPRNITESSDMTAQVSAVGTFLFLGQFEMKIRVDGTQQEVIWFTSASLTHWIKNFSGVWEEWPETAIWARTFQMPKLFLLPTICFQRLACPWVTPKQSFWEETNEVPLTEISVLDHSIRSHSEFNLKNNLLEPFRPFISARGALRSSFVQVYWGLVYTQWTSALFRCALNSVTTSQSVENVPITPKRPLFSLFIGPLLLFQTWQPLIWNIYCLALSRVM